MSDKKQLFFEAIAIKGNVAYASDYNRNGLFKVDMSTGECEFIKLFEGELVDKKRLHCAAIWKDSKIYFIPGSANRIDVFCPESNSMETIDIPLPKSKQFRFYNAQFKFIRAIENEDTLWLLPCSYPGIIKLNTKSNNIQIFDKWLEEDEYFFRIGVAVEDKKIIIANGKSNAVLIFDMEKEFGRVEHIGTKNNGVMSICKVGDNYFLAPRLPGAIIEWNSITNKVSEYAEYPSEFESGSIVFSNVYCVFGKIIFIPARANYGLIYDNGSFHIDNSYLFKKYCQSTVEYLFETDDERYFRETDGIDKDRYFKINKIDNTLSEYSFYYFDNKERDKSMISIMSTSHEIVRETKVVGLRELIKGLV